MPATVTLEENGRVLHFTFQDPVNYAEINAVEQQANTWYDKATGKLHTVLDLRQLHKLPDGFLKLRKTNGLTHRNAGNTAVLGASVYVQTIGETIFRLARNNRTRFFADDKERDAWDYLRQLIASETGASQSQPKPAPVAEQQAPLA